MTLLRNYFKFEREGSRGSYSWPGVRSFCNRVWQWQLGGFNKDREVHVPRKIQWTKRSGQASRNYLRKDSQARLNGWQANTFAWRPGSQYNVAATRGADNVLASDCRDKFGRPSTTRGCRICVTVRLPVRPRG